MKERVIPREIFLVKREAFIYRAFTYEGILRLIRTRVYEERLPW